MISIIATIVGYLASLLLAISLLVSNDLKFRWLNSLGCLCFIAYGLIIGAFPVMLTNVLLLCINVFYLVKIYRTKENFDLLEFSPGNMLVDKLMLFYKEDIERYFPEYDFTVNMNDLRFVVLRDIVVANIFVAELSGDGNARVKLNYTIPKYRDYKVGRYLFEKEKAFLIAKGVKCVVYNQQVNPKHEKFLKVMGFEKKETNTSIQYTKCF